jgi:cytochrome c-type biogenesis protein CcmH/NrfG
MAQEYGTRAWHSLGRIRFHRGDAPGAVDAFAQALKLDAKSAVIWFELGQAHLALGRPAEAEPCLAEATKLDPRNPAYQEALLKTALLRRQAEVEKGVKPAAPGPDDKPTGKQP